MFEKISYTWRLMRASWDILMRDKGLLIFPLFSSISCLLIMASFAIPIYRANAWHPPARDAQVAQQIAYYGTLFCFYFANYFVITFFNAAMVACAVNQLQGGNPSIAYGFNTAASRIHLIFGWALLSATVGLALRLIEDRSKRVGQIIAGLFGMAWTVLSYLVVPILVVEQKGPFAALKESSVLLKKTWGERLVGNASFGTIFFLLALPGIAMIAIGIALSSSTHSATPVIGFVAIAVIYFVVLSLIHSVLQVIFQSAVYLYAAQPAAIQSSGPRGFPVELISNAMAQRSRN
jgi:Family of unknown function (DUF6159)